jgi:hypothetical protein
MDEAEDRVLLAKEWEEEDPQDEEALGEAMQTSRRGAELQSRDQQNYQE